MLCFRRLGLIRVRYDCAGFSFVATFLFEHSVPNSQRRLVVAALASHDGNSSEASALLFSALASPRTAPTLSSSSSDALCVASAAPARSLLLDLPRELVARFVCPFLPLHELYALQLVCLEMKETIVEFPDLLTNLACTGS